MAGNAINLSSAGVSLNYAVESSAGTMPTTGFTKLTGIKAIPDIDPEPSNLDATTFDNLEWMSYIPGLKDPGGAVGFTANNTEVFQTEWAALCEAAATGQAAGKATWFAVIIPGLTKAFMFSGTPSDLGLSAIEVDSVLEVNAYVTPNEIVGWEATPTVGE